MTTTTTDYYSRSYVINECIAHSTLQSSKLLCDDEKISLLYFGDCNDCSCGDGIEQVYEYYADKDCFDVTCNSNVILSAYQRPKNMLQIKGDYVKRMFFRDSNPVSGTGEGLEALQSEFVMNKNLGVEDVISPISSLSFSMSAIIGSVLLMVFCVLCRYMNQWRHKKEYEEL